MERENRHKPDVIIKFNGQAHSLEQWVKKETAAERERLPESNRTSSEKAERKASIVDQPGYLAHYQKNKTIRGRKRTFRASQILKIISHFWLPGAAAIVIGLVIGLTMLTAFSGKGNTGSAAWSERLSTSSINVPSGKITGKSLELSIYVIQTGVFSTKERASQVAGNLRREGFSALTAGNNPTAVLIGGAFSKKGAGQLENYYKNRNIPAYQKYLQIQVQNSSKVLKNDKQAILTLKAKTFVQTLLTAAEENSGGQNVSDKTVRQMVSILDDWKRTDPGPKNASEQMLVGNMETVAGQAVTQAQALQHTKSGENDERLQQSALEMVALYQNLILIH
ncbi:SPOR domain-containing protein [Sporolactobacillus pectinivorans]|uniref:SPOR domain-containing protein n=1 Tax=Sporolactobacillus pectinivorans TaxID=1591408 RepID=UPI000C2664EA|nr:hypothetical protein [Sporolactobacillus pectinivorans]